MGYLKTASCGNDNRMELEMYKGKPNTDNYEFFYRAVLSLNNEDECRGFFDDIMTRSELEAIAQRVKIGIMLLEGQTFSEINTQTSASSATITKVNQRIKHGSGSILNVLTNLKEEN